MATTTTNLEAAKQEQFYESIKRESERLLKAGRPLDLADVRDVFQLHFDQPAAPADEGLPMVGEPRIEGSPECSYWIVRDVMGGYEYLRKDGKWHKSTGYGEGYYQTRNEAERQLRDCATKEQAAKREADADIEARRVKSFSSMEALIAEQQPAGGSASMPPTSGDALPAVSQPRPATLATQPSAAGQKTYEDKS